MNYLKYLVFFIIVFVFIYLLYFFVIAQPQVRALRYKSKEEEKDNKKKKKKDKNKKEKKYPTELAILSSFYKINIEKIGFIRSLRILNFVDALVMALLVTAVIPIKATWLKLLVLTLVIVPVIWVTYYFLAKYLKHLERKYENE